MMLRDERKTAFAQPSQFHAVWFIIVQEVSANI